MKKIKYFTGSTFSQLEEIEKKINICKNEKEINELKLIHKRTKKSIFCNIGILTEKFIKEYYKSSNEFEIIKIQKWLTLKENEFLLRNSIEINGFFYSGLKIYDLNKFEKFNKIKIFINENYFLKMIFKDILGKMLKDFKEEMKDKLFLKKYTKDNYFNFKSQIKNINFNKEYIEIEFHNTQYFQKEDLKHIKDKQKSFFQELGIFSNQKQKIRSDLIIKNKNTNVKYIIEIKSRAGSGLKKSDIFSSIYYPLYYNYINYNDKLGLKLIYLGDLNIKDGLEDLKIKYKKITNASFSLTSFNKAIELIKSKNNFNLSGYRMSGTKLDNNSKYTIDSLVGEEISFILDYEFNTNLEIQKTENNSAIQKEIIRDSQIKL